MSEQSTTPIVQPNPWDPPSRDYAEPSIWDATRGPSPVPHITHAGPDALRVLGSILSGERWFGSVREREQFATGVLLAVVPPDVRAAFNRVCQMLPCPELELPERKGLERAMGRRP